MSQEYNLEEQYEMFEGDIRRLEELTSQLGLWCDEFTINHKKEEIRLPEYVELHNNLEELRESLEAFIDEHLKEEGETERLLGYQEVINNKLIEYKETEAHIHDWIREIKNIDIIIMKSQILQEHRTYIEEIVKVK